MEDPLVFSGAASMVLTAPWRQQDLVRTDMLSSTLEWCTHPKHSTDKDTDIVTNIKVVLTLGSEQNCLKFFAKKKVHPIWPNQVSAEGVRSFLGMSEASYPAVSKCRVLKIPSSTVFNLFVHNPAL